MNETLMTYKEPLISLILTVKNGLPYLNECLESLRRQSYRNFELIVQDCLSTDGSSELLRGFASDNVNYARERDNGIGDANRRAFARCRGDILGTIDSDNLLAEDALALVAEHFREHSDTAVIYGNCQMISADGAPMHLFRPATYDYLSLIGSELVLPWSSAFFNLKRCRSLLDFDANLKTCVDFSIWLRLSAQKISYIDAALSSVRISAKSMSVGTENYDQFCQDKIKILTKYVSSIDLPESIRSSLLRYGQVGVYCWAADSVYGIAPTDSHLVAKFYQRAIDLAPNSQRALMTKLRVNLV